MYKWLCYTQTGQEAGQDQETGQQRERSANTLSAKQQRLYLWWLLFDSGTRKRRPWLWPRCGLPADPLPIYKMWCSVDQSVPMSVVKELQESKQLSEYFALGSLDFPDQCAEMSLVYHLLSRFVCITMSALLWAESSTVVVKSQSVTEREIVIIKKKKPIQFYVR